MVPFVIINAQYVTNVLGSKQYKLALAVLDLGSDDYTDP